MYQPQSEATMMKDDGKMVHNCAKHVEHAEYGQGQCIAEEHAAPDRNGNIAWYDIVFEHGVERGVPVTELNVLHAESHMHATKKTKKMAEEAGGVPEKPAGGSNGATPEDHNRPIKKKAMDAAMAAANKTATGAGAQDKIVKQGMTKEAYTGKNPHIIKSVSSAGKGAMMVTTNAGAKHTLTGKDTGGKMPKAGEHINTYVKEDAETVDEKVMAFHATKPGGPMQRFHKDSPAPGAQAHRDATAAAVKGLRAAGKIKSKELSQGGTDEITTPKGGRVWAKNVKEDAESVDEVMQVFHQTSPGAQMKRYQKDSPAPEAAAHRNAAAAAVKGLRATGALKRKSFSYGSTDDIKTPKGGTVMAMKRESFEYLYAEAEQVDETIITADRDYDIIAEKNYREYFNAMLKKHRIKHPGELPSDEAKKAFFKKVDDSFQAKNEDVFLEAYMASDLDDVKSAHKKAGNKISDEKSATKGGQAHHSFVVTTPAGKRTRHIYHGSTKKMESMSAAPRSKEAKETGEDDEEPMPVKQRGRKTNYS